MWERNMAQENTPIKPSVSIDEVVTTVVMARVTDFFGFFVYAIASALVFPRLFFPMFEPLTGTLISFSVFSLAFLARPVAALLGRKLQDRIGKAGKIVVGLLLLGSATMAIGLLPSFDSIGWYAPALLVVLRVIQGLGLGASWDGFTLQLQAASPVNRRGLYGMVPQLGAPIGFAVAASLFYVLTDFLTEEEFFSFGWRFAFFCVLAVNIVSLFARLRLLTENFGSDPALLEPSPFRKLIRHQWKPVLLSALMPLSAYALMHMVTVFPLAHALLFSRYEISFILMLQLIGGALAICTVFVSGILSDRIGRPRVLLLSSAGVLALSLTIGTLESNPAVYIVFGFVVLGLAYGCSSAIAPARFDVGYRYSGPALSTNLSWIFGAAFAPLIGLTLSSTFGLWAASIYLLSGALVTTLMVFLRYGIPQKPVHT